jgi:predicted RNA-binding Zn-ribbon protein involved in translation (DUF1610 family)
VNVECQSCGWKLEVPPGAGEGREFACGNCGLLLRNVEPTREFRWSSLDPYTRRYGASRLRFWGGLLVGSLWLPALAAALTIQNTFDPLFVTALGVPWFAIELWLARRRAGIPSVRWYVFLWIGIGAFVMYVAILVALIPKWRPLLGIGENPDALKIFFVFGVLAMMVGVAGASLYGWVLKRTPIARASQPNSREADPS